MYTGAGGQVLTIPGSGPGGTVSVDDYMVAMSYTNATTLDLDIGAVDFPKLMLGALPYHGDPAAFSWFFGKRLDAADIAAMTITTVTGSDANYPLFIAIFRGAVSAHLLDFAVSPTQTSPDLTFAAFTPDATFVADVVMMLDKAGTISTTVEGSPATWTFLYNGNPETSGYFGEYEAFSTNSTGAATTFTPFGPTDYQTGGRIEMRSV